MAGIEPCSLAAFLGGIRPAPELTVSEWADRHGVIITGSEAGPYRTDRTPYMREIVDCLSEHHPARKVVFKKCAQIGATEGMYNWLGYIVDHAPAPSMMVQPTVELAKGHSKERLAPRIRNTPALADKIRDSRERDSESTMLLKIFPGGSFTLTGANSPVGLASKPLKNLLLDEIDRWPGTVGDEGDPLKIVEARTDTYPDFKIVLASTPTLTEISRIEREWKKSDQRRYHLPCPFCNYFQALQLANLKWEKDEDDKVIPESVRYLCAGCGQLITENHKPAMLHAGEWIPANPKSIVRGYHVWGAYRPLGWKSWAAIAEDFQESHKDRSLLQPFFNLELGEPWEETGEKIEADALIARRETYPAPLPMGVGILTVGVDIQDDRIEVATKGWGRRFESWLIDWRYLLGDPAKLAVWDRLEEYLLQEWEHEAGLTMQAQAVGVDTGAHTAMAYDFCKPRWKRGVFALKGSSETGKPIASRPTRTNIRKIRLYAVGTDTAKDIIFARLKILEPGPGYLHYPDRPEISEEYFKGLTAEKAVVRYVRGVKVRKYVKVRARNEPLDLEVYNLAALSILNVDLEKWADYVEQQATRRKAAPRAPAETSVKIIEHEIKRIERESGAFPDTDPDWVQGWKK